ncbi:MAG TPA: DUF599 domain-containing protein [Magnetospirillaceae bacterium]|jgi:uncharacterized membrane protein
MSWISLGDAAALVVSVAMWLGFGMIVDHSPWSARTLTVAVNKQRYAWMRIAMDRDFKIVDATLVGMLMHSISFLASAALIILGVVAAALGAVGTDMETVQQKIPFLHPETAEQIEVKLILIGVIFIYSFLNFTWSLQQFNYCCILLGASPRETVADDEKARFAERLGRLLSRGGRSFNRGLRGFYFALAGLGWFVHPLALVGATLAVVLILGRREFFSVTRREMMDR